MVKSHQKTMLKPELTKPEADYAIRGVLANFIQALNNTPGDYDDLAVFLTTYGKVSYVERKHL